MCGIVGIFPGDERQAESALAVLGHRGRDASRVLRIDAGVVGHVLHALVSNVPQPLVGAGTLLFNGQIYNWKELAEEEGVPAQNDTHILLHLLDTHGADAVRDRLDGVYAYAYIRDGTCTVERDRLGVKPLWYSTERGFAFASEKKALEAIGLLARELHPRSTVRCDLATMDVSAAVRPLVFPAPRLSVDAALALAVQKRIPPSGRVGVLFSGGIDSALVARLASDAGAEVTLYVAALDDPEKRTAPDLEAARTAASELGLPLVEARATLAQVEVLLPELCALIEDSNVIKVGVALPFFLACRAACDDGQRVVLSGLGAEEVFAGYQRHKQARDVNQECLRGLRAMHERDLYRDDVVSMRHTVELRLPLLDLQVIAAGLAIPGEEKIVGGLGKVPLREAAIRLGVPEHIAMRPKRAAQYGSQFDAAIGKLARRAGKGKSGYLRELYPANARLCALLSSGKDSVYALYAMQRMNYDVVCAATVRSENPDSYMYHTPLVEAADLQARSMGIPLLIESTSGEKEEELSALRSVLARARDAHRIDGVVSGALFSDYQRTRIERVCEELGLRVYAPLWHIDQQQEVREILDAGFTFVLSKVAADGLDRSWVGRPITHADVDTLAGKLGLNVAGEGGEYESLVLDGPNFSFPLALRHVSVECERDGGSGDVCVLRAEPRSADD